MSLTWYNLTMIMNNVWYVFLLLNKNSKKVQMKIICVETRNNISFAGDGSIN